LNFFIFLSAAFIKEKQANTLCARFSINQLFNWCYLITEDTELASKTHRNYIIILKIIHFYICAKMSIPLKNIYLKLKIMIERKTRIKKGSPNSTLFV